MCACWAHWRHQRASRENKVLNIKPCLENSFLHMWLALLMLDTLLLFLASFPHVLIKFTVHFSRKLPNIFVNLSCGESHVTSQQVIRVCLLMQFHLCWWTKIFLHFLRSNISSCPLMQMLLMPVLSLDIASISWLYQRIQSICLAASRSNRSTRYHSTNQKP